MTKFENFNRVINEAKLILSTLRYEGRINENTFDSITSRLESAKGFQINRVDSINGMIEELTPFESVSTNGKVEPGYQGKINTGKDTYYITLVKLA